MSNKIPESFEKGSNAKKAMFKADSTVKVHQREEKTNKNTTENPVS